MFQVSNNILVLVVLLYYLVAEDSCNGTGTFGFIMTAVKRLFCSNDHRMENIYQPSPEKALTTIICPFIDHGIGGTPTPQGRVRHEKHNLKVFHKR